MTRSLQSVPGVNLSPQVDCIPSLLNPKDLLETEVEMLVFGPGISCCLLPQPWLQLQVIKAFSCGSALPHLEVHEKGAIDTSGKLRLHLQPEILGSMCLGKTQSQGLGTQEKRGEDSSWLAFLSPQDQKQFSETDPSSGLFQIPLTPPNIHREPGHSLCCLPIHTLMQTWCFTSIQLDFSSPGTTSSVYWPHK